MNKEFIDALDQLARERSLDKMQLLESFEEALQQAYERNVEPGKTIEVEVDPESGEVEVLIVKRVVEEVEDPEKEMTLEEALELDDSIEVGMEMEFPVDKERFTRIAVQTTKQVITQKIREAERSVVFEEYKDREGEVITAMVSRQDNKRNVFVDLGRGEAIMPPKEQIPGERYMVGMRLKIYIAKVEQKSRGPSILVSRAAPELLRYLMRQEIPEVSDDTVEIRAIAREAGQRSKVAVTSRNPNVDPIGACIGHRGSRIQAVTAELQRERVDIIMWDASPREFIRNALSPAKVGHIDVDLEGETAKVMVGNDQLSLAIGKGGQNVRLAAKLTNFKIDLIASENVSDLDAAMQAAASRLDEVSYSGASDSKRAAFDALFSASPEGKEEETDTALTVSADTASTNTVDAKDTDGAAGDTTGDVTAEGADRADKQVSVPTEGEAEGEVEQEPSPETATEER